MSKRNTHLAFQQHRENIREGRHRQRTVDFFNELTGPLLLELTEAHLPEHRERLYPPTVTLSMFIKQLPSLYIKKIREISSAIADLSDKPLDICFTL